MKQNGLSAETVARMRGVFARYPQISQVILYGSRAKGNARPGSDIDLTIKGQGLTYDDLNRLERELDDLLLPYKIDVSLYALLDHEGLLAHIDRVGVVFYERVDNYAAVAGEVMEEQAIR
jgi:predicted nucleotidyltransferase